MKRLFIMFLCCVALRSTALATNVGTASTSVYVRSVETGEVVGSLSKGDKVEVVSEGDWARVKINGTEYKVWSEYLDVNEEEGAEFISKPRASKSSTKDKKSGVKNKKAQKFTSDSCWDNIGAAFGW